MWVEDVAGQMEDPCCPLCEANERRLLYRNAAEGGGLSGVPVSIVQCEGCGFLFTAPRLKASVFEAYYAASSLASGQVYRDESAAGVYPRLYAKRAEFLASFLVRRASGRLLDIGCGNGGFLRALADQPLAGWELHGLEPSQGAVAHCRRQGFDVACAALGAAVFPENSFDAISLVSVLEHLPDPLVSLRWCRRVLKPDGLLFIEVPDNLQPELSLTSHFNVEHIVHFTPWSLCRMLAEAGFSEHLRAADAAGVIRQASATSLGAWGRPADPPTVDNRDEVRRVVEHYADAERRLLADIRTIVGETLSAWRAEGLRVAIYGAGIHSVQLARLVDLGGVACFIDGDPAKQGGRFLDLPVYAPEALVDLGVAAVLISSNRFVDEMVRKVRQVSGDNVRVATCYR